jgi:hypothetical protein
MAHSLLTKEWKFRLRRFQMLDNDELLIQEIKDQIDSLAPGT